MESAYSLYFRLAMFLAHALTAVFFLVQGFRSDCDAILSRTHYTSYTDPFVPEGAAWNGWPVHTPNDGCGPPQFPNATSLGLPTADWRDSWCQATATPALWDVTQDVRSFTPGASWNVLVLILVFEWVTASYALLYTEEPAALWASIPVPPGTVAQPFIGTVWNLALLVVLWVCRAQLRVPDNNLLIYTAVLGVAMLAQNFLAGGRQAGPEEKEPLVASTALQAEWHTEHFLRQRKPSRGRAVGDSTVFLGAGAKFAFHDIGYHASLDTSGEAVVARLVEYACTAPLLLVGIMLNVNTSGLTWTFQIIYFALAACNAVGPVIHYAALLDRPKARIAAWIALLASWLMFASGFAIYVFAGRDWLFQAPSSSGMPDWVFGLVWLVLLAYSSFGIVFTYYYYPLLCGSPVDARTVTASVVWWMDILSLVVKLAVAWTVYSKGSVVNCKAYQCQ